MSNRDRDCVRCSFCGKRNDQVRKILSGPNGVYICDECIELCNELINEEFEDEMGSAPLQALNEWFL